MTDVVTYDVVPRAGVIDLGKQVEGLVTRVVLPNIRRGKGAVQLVHQRSDDQKPYLVPITEDGDKVYWIVNRLDTAYPGRGQAELQWLGVNGEVAKSVTYQTNTTRSMAEPGAVPDEPLKPYTQAVARDAQAAKDAAASATEAARSAEASAGQAGLSAATATEAARNAEAIVGQAGQAAQSAQTAALAAAKNAAAAEAAEAGAKQAQTGAQAAKTEAQTAKTAAEKAAQEAKTAQTGAVEAKAGAETAQEKAEKAAQGVAADREQIGANTAGLETATQELTVLKAESTTLKTENTALKAETARTARSLDYLWKKSKGIIYDTETVTGAGSSVTVPSGAMDYAALRKLGGMSRKGRNLLNYDAWKTVPTTNGTAVFENNGVTITAAGNDAYTNLSGFPVAAQIAVNQGDSITLTWEADNDEQGGVYIFPNGKIANNKVVDNAQAKRLNYTVPEGVTYITFRFGVAKAGITIAYKNIMIQKNTTATDWEPYTDSLLDAPVDAVRVANAAGDITNTYPIPQAIRDMCPDYGQGTVDAYNYINFTAKTYHHAGSMSQDGTWTALATPEIIDLSAVWPDDFGILQVEAGGTINLHYPALDDGYELAVPSETEIMVDVAKVVQTNE